MTARAAARCRDVVVIGASLGGVVTLRDLFARLLPPSTGSVFIVLHRNPYHPDRLVEVLRGGTSHDIGEARDGERSTPGRIYLAPRDRHMVLEDGRVRLVRGPTEHFTRPAIDPLFRSAAAVYGDRVAGVLLTGNGHDGVSGLIAIKAAGGLTIAQDPSEAAAPS